MALPTTGLTRTGFRRVSGAMIRSYVLPFTAAEYWALMPSGALVRGLGDQYRIDILDPNGAVSRIERRFDPVPLVESERRAAQPEPNFPPPPEFKPAFQAMFVSPDGSIWIRPHLPARERENPSYDPSDPESPRTIWVEDPIFDIYRADGTYEGALHIPAEVDLGPRAPRPVRRGDQVWAVTEDSLEVQRVTRFRIVPRSEGSSE